MPSGGQNKLSIEQIKQRIFAIHGDIVQIDETTYQGIKKRARFIDRDFGDWTVQVRQVLRGPKHRHPNARKRETLISNSMKFHVDLGCFSFDDDSSMIYGYLDMTSEDESRPFYVGQGAISRIFVFERNNKHTATKRRLGLIRKIIFKTSSNLEIDDWETRNIAAFGTFTANVHYDGTDIGCNLVPIGGSRRGSTVSEKTKQLISAGIRKNCADPVHIKKLSDAQKKRFEDPAQRELISQQVRQRTYSDEVCKKHSESARKQWENVESRHRIYNARWPKQKG